MSHTHGICQVAIAPVRADKNDESEILTQLLFGDYIKVIEFGKPWTRIYFPSDDYEGWMDFKQLHFISEQTFENGVQLEHDSVKSGIMKIKGPIGEQHIIFGSNLPFLNGSSFLIGDIQCTVIDPLPTFNETLVDTSLRYLNTPYLWGGKGIFGIDCSGLTQIVAKAHGINLPRDASQQCQVGKGIMFDAREKGDLMYFVNEKGSVHHVGILISANEIIHASGHVRIDKYDEDGIYRTDFDEYTHKFHSIKRIWIK